MDFFRTMVLVAAAAGLIAGLGMTVAQQFTTVPLILKAEVFEQAGEAKAGPQHEHADVYRFASQALMYDGMLSILTQTQYPFLSPDPFFRAGFHLSKLALVRAIGALENLLTMLSQLSLPWTYLQPTQFFTTPG